MKKGFTLIELLAVIFILTLVLVVGLPKVLKIMDNVKIDSYLKNMESLNQAAENYFAVNFDLLPKNIGDTVEVTLSTLQTDGVIDPIKDPYDNTDCNGYVLVSKTDSGYNYQPELKCRDSNTIGDSTSDGLILYYNFDERSESTENLMPFYSLDQDSENQTNPAGRFDYFTAEGGTYTLSGYVTRYSDDVVTNPRITIIFKYDDATTNSYVTNLNDIPADNNEYFYQVTGTSDPDKTLSEVYGYVFDYSTHGLRHISARDIQLEKMDHATNFAAGTRISKVIDKSTNNNHSSLLLTEQPAWNSNDGNGYYYFDGTKRIYSPLVTDIMNFNGVDKPFSLSFWVKPTARKKSYDGFINLLGSTGSYDGILVSFYSNDSKYRVRYWQDGGTNLEIVPNTAMSVWNKIDITVSNKVCTIYLNGIKYREDNFVNNFVFNGYFYLGYYHFEDNYFTGYIDDLKMYNRALTAEEIKYQYDITKEIFK